ncbi:MAG: ester cyclase [Anaerolineae bacterium]|nr:ester cyclase [Anaerolineae bacterium]
MVGGIWRNAFSGFKITVDNVIGEGNHVFNRGSVSGTHIGVFNGIPATGKSIHVGYFENWVVKDGKLSANWVQLDYYGLLLQLGVIPQPQAS